MIEKLAPALLTLSLASMLPLTGMSFPGAAANASAILICDASMGDPDMFEQSNTSSRPSKASDLPPDPGMQTGGSYTPAEAVQPAPEVIPQETPPPVQQASPPPAPVSQQASPTPVAQPATTTSTVRRAATTTDSQPKAIAERLSYKDQLQSEKTPASSHKGLIPFSAGAIAGAPVSMFRKSVNEINTGAKSLSKGSTNPMVKVPAALISLPFCTAAGCLEGVAFSAKHGRACSTSGD